MILSEDMCLTHRHIIHRAKVCLPTSFCERSVLISVSLSSLPARPPLSADPPLWIPLAFSFAARLGPQTPFGHAAFGRRWLLFMNQWTCLLSRTTYTREPSSGKKDSFVQTKSTPVEFPLITFSQKAHLKVHGLMRAKHRLPVIIRFTHSSALLHCRVSGSP